MRIIQAFRTFFSILVHGKLPEDIVVAFGLMRRSAAAAPRQQAVAGAAEGAVQMLAILQREARLVDFLFEDISAFSDEQVGAAVRGVHKDSRAALKRHFTISPLIDGVEGAVASLAGAGLDAADAASVRLVGNVPPEGRVESGILRHRGWKVEGVDLPAVKPARGTQILAPAEIEVE